MGSHFIEWLNDLIASLKLRSSSRVGVLDNGVNNNRINFILNNINLHSWNF